ncbi:riboflavin biosynthesis protein RibD domain-containing protein [Pochonia chlamydosporia 170]|uniref:2,5-diamino-6-ribosylamino-4(3H)-pyrimidinone 5'-phosphate reductase n=1 Tax=Pochonia chlamydosporia 170 TaxID=1380566 RepID=A0A179F5D1_METCM|nr:riboflavin biosynthesis protein RibD domain-containing protein [Pochonia chlamydosporia 170]OAQ60551.1 riboflavin biosynthesis protein RibD domain-containing protein [Pochonia chlamydosporia 170]
MRRVRYNAAISLDGFIASPDGSTDWIVEDTSIDFDALYAQFDIYIMGRKTYEVVTSHGDFNPLGSKAKENVIVVSREMKQEEYPNITILQNGFIDTIRRLKSQDGKDIWFMGGGQLAAPLLEAGLIDTFEMAIMPAVLGKGIKMIAESDKTDKAGYSLDLTGLEKLDKSGIVILKYAVRYGK